MAHTHPIDDDAQPAAKRMRGDGPVLPAAGSESPAHRLWQELEAAYPPPEPAELPVKPWRFRGVVWLLAIVLSLAIWAGILWLLLR